MKEALIATRNRGKLREIGAILAPLGWNILSLNDFPGVPEIEEDRPTFAGNAEKKAAEAARFTGKLTIADDSGLVVDALRGRPGVFSSRYAGENATDEDRYQKVLSEMAAIPRERRQAAFVCAIAISFPEGRIETVEGEIRGEIAPVPRGDNGFGYDPIFLIPDLGKTMAEIGPEIKNRISHRARA
ncbi:MAG TPA: XTP/dITP diphosphatase, partial [Thermodesulfobacteriota bacterium]|nr:XTP/dITP diphosphatase [Thermodesulfobacteriota bacterium]